MNPAVTWSVLVTWEWKTMIRKLRLLKLGGRNYLEIPALNGNVTLKLMLEEWGGICGVIIFAFATGEVKW
jgi:hypothetical protein